VRLLGKSGETDIVRERKDVRFLGKSGEITTVREQFLWSMGKSGEIAIMMENKDEVTGEKSENGYTEGKKRR